MFGSDFSRTYIGAVVMLHERQSFNKDFFAGTRLPNTVDDKALSRPKLKASGILFFFDNAHFHLTSDKHNRLEIKRSPHPSDSPDLASYDFWPFKYHKHYFG
jgi:hypothetical protein